MPRDRPTKGATSETTLRSKATRANSNGANLGFEAQLFLAADKLRKNLEPSDYKHVALGLIFLKHISNAFEAKRAGACKCDIPRYLGIATPYTQTTLKRRIISWSSWERMWQCQTH